MNWAKSESECKEGSRSGMLDKFLFKNIDLSGKLKEDVDKGYTRVAAIFFKDLSDRTTESDSLE